MTESQMFTERLKQALYEAGYPARPVVLEREFNQRYWGKPVTVQAVRKWLVGDVIPTQDKLQALAEWLKVDPHWLRFGEKLNGSLQEQRARWDVKMTPADRSMIEKLMSLPAEKRKLINEIVIAFYQQQEPK